MAKGGQKTIYTARYDVSAERLAEAGFTDLEISAFLNINPDTYYNWRNKHPSFSEAIDRGKASPNQKVVAALFQRAIGGEELEETHTEGVVDEEGKIVGKRKVKKIKKKALPDVTAMKYWLGNRDPNRWKERVDMNHSGEVKTKTISETLAEIPIEERKEALEALRKAGVV